MRMNRGISQPKERSCSVGCRCGTALKTTCFALSTEASGINKRFLVAALNAENLSVCSKWPGVPSCSHHTTDATKTYT